MLSFLTWTPKFLITVVFLAWQLHWTEALDWDARVGSKLNEEWLSIIITNQMDQKDLKNQISSSKFSASVSFLQGSPLVSSVNLFALSYPLQMFIKNEPTNFVIQNFSFTERPLEHHH